MLPNSFVLVLYIFSLKISWIPVYIFAKLFAKNKYFAETSAITNIFVKILAKTNNFANIWRNLISSKYCHKNVIYHMLLTGFALFVRNLRKIQHLLFFVKISQLFLRKFPQNCENINFLSNSMAFAVRTHFSAYLEPIGLLTSLMPTGMLYILCLCSGSCCYLKKI